jgi:hypothetical protein
MRARGVRSGTPEVDARFEEPWRASIIRAPEQESSPARGAILKTIGLAGTLEPDDDEPLHPA